MLQYDLDACSTGENAQTGTKKNANARIDVKSKQLRALQPVGFPVLRHKHGNENPGEQGDDLERVENQRQGVTHQQTEEDQHGRHEERDLQAGAD